MSTCDLSQRTARRGVLRHAGWLAMVVTFAVALGWGLTARRSSNASTGHSAGASAPTLTAPTTQALGVVRQLKNADGSDPVRDSTETTTHPTNNDRDDVRSATPSSSPLSPTSAANANSVEAAAEVAPGPSPAQTRPDQPPAEARASDDTRQQILGRWHDSFYGERVFEFFEDGTARMELKLDSVGSLLYGPKLTFFIDWTLENNTLTLKMTGGEPAGTARTVAKLFGETSQQQVISVNADEMQLKSLDSGTVYLHQRMRSSSSAAESSAEPPRSAD
jgi:hypothetical protein